MTPEKRSPLEPGWTPPELVDAYPWLRMVSWARVETLLAPYGPPPSLDNWAIACEVLEDVYGRPELETMEAQEVENNLAAGLAGLTDRSGTADVLETLFHPGGMPPEVRQQVETMEKQVERELRDQFHLDDLQPWRGKSGRPAAGEEEKKAGMDADADVAE